MADSSLELNLGVGGKVLDTEDVTFGVAPTTRVRERVQITGAAAAEVARVRADGPVATDNALVVRAVGLPNLVGTWSYRAGASGTVTVTAGRRVIGIAAHALVAGTITIDGGDSIPVPANTGISITPLGNLVAPVIVFTSTDTFFVETLA